MASFIIGHTRQVKENSARHLEEECRRLAMHLLTVADQLALRKQGHDPVINELGEVQGAAARVDSACGRYVTARRLAQAAEWGDGKEWV